MPAGKTFANRRILMFVDDVYEVSSRKPDDLPDFCEGIFEVLAKNS